MLSENVSFIKEVIFANKDGVFLLHALSNNYSLLLFPNNDMFGDHQVWPHAQLGRTNVKQKCSTVSLTLMVNDIIFQGTQPNAFFDTSILKI